MYHGACKFNNHKIASILSFETQPTSDASDALSSLSAGTSEEYEWEFKDTTTYKSEEFIMVVLRHEILQNFSTLFNFPMIIIIKKLLFGIL